MGIEYTDHSSQEEEPLNQMAPLRNKHFGETSVEFGLLNCEVTTLSNSTEYLGILAYFVHSVELNRTTEKKSPKRAYSVLTTQLPMTNCLISLRLVWVIPHEMIQLRLLLKIRFTNVFT